jgi:hypothetical protein
MAGFTNSTPLSHILARQITKALLVAEKRDTMPSSSSIEPSQTEYRRFADECLRWADRVPRLDQKNTLIEIAQVWMHAALMIEYDHSRSRPPRLPSGYGRNWKSSFAKSWDEKSSSAVFSVRPNARQD